jgi:hypothetical protein
VTGFHLDLLVLVRHVGHGMPFGGQADHTQGPMDLQAHVFVAAMEVLDNLPHDRVERANSTSPWQETWVTQASSGQWHHELRPLEDHTIAECLSTFEWVSDNKELAGASHMRLPHPAPS